MYHILSLTGRRIAEAVNDFPQNVVIGAISRAGEFVTPRGDTIVEPDDHLIVFLDTAALESVTEVV